MGFDRIILLFDTVAATVRSGEKVLMLLAVRSVKQHLAEKERVMQAYPPVCFPANLSIFIDHYSGNFVYFVQSNF